MSDTLEAHRLQIEHILGSLGVEVTAFQPEPGDEDPEEHVWMLGAGSATVIARLIWDSEAERGWFRVSSPLVHLPEKNLLAFYRRLLELNAQLPGVSLAAVRDRVELCGERPLAGMEPEEAKDLLTRVAACADKLDDMLHQTFGAPLWESESG